MKKSKDQNTCIRIDRDAAQIKECKSQLLKVNGELLKIAQILALAGNEVRLKILYLIQVEKKLCVCDLSEILDMKIPAVSQHLRKMRDASLVFTEREGTVIFYRICPPIKPKLDTILNLIREPISEI